MNCHEKHEKIKELISKRICDYLFCSDGNDKQYPDCAILNRDDSYSKCGCVKFKVAELAGEILKAIDIEYEEMKEPKSFSEYLKLNKNEKLKVLAQKEKKNPAREVKNDSN